MQDQSKILAGVGLFTLALVIGGVFILSRGQNNPQIEDVTTSCVTHGGLGMHIHPHLAIIANGKQVEIPANIGIVSPTCMRPIHTHDNSGTLHLEFKRPRDVKLGEFFQVWGKTFSKDQILDFKIDEKHEIKVMVNDQPNFDFENLVMKDKDKIVIEYLVK